jgi:sugar lactone lactonase YvrE
MPDAAAPGKENRRDPGYGVSTGVEWDPKRKLLWLVQTDGAVYTMRFERKSAGIKPVAKE